MFSTATRRLLLLGFVSLLVAASAHAVTYTETGDAGQLIGTAQPTAANQGAANQPLTAIFGSLLSATDIDLFKINITNPSTFSATTVNTLTDGSGLDTELFLFASNGRPVYANDDDPSGITLGSTLPAGNALGPQVAGVYYLGISYSGADPLNAASIALFTANSPSTTLRGPNPSATGPLTGWSTSGIDATGTTFPGSYEIDLTGATTAAVPEPATLAFVLLGVASVVIVRKQQKIANQ